MISDFVAGIVITAVVSLILFYPLFRIIGPSILCRDIGAGGGVGGIDFMVIIEVLFGAFVLIGLPAGLLLYATLNGVIDYKLISKYVSIFIPTFEYQPQTTKVKPTTQKPYGNYYNNIQR